MQTKHWFVVCVLALAACTWKVHNETYCPPGRACDPVVISCNPDGDCEKPLVCKQDTMVCVQCTENSHCQAGAPTCDTQTNKCVQCTKHADCESDLCFDDQTCADPAEVLHVSAAGMDNPICSKGMPCKLLKTALTAAGFRKYIRVKGTVTDMADTPIDDTIGKPVHIYGDPGTSVLTRSTDGPVVSVKRSADVTFVDVDIKGTAAISDGLDLRDAPGPMVTMIRGKLSGHSGKGAVLTAGALTLRRTQVLENRMYGIDASGGATLTLEGAWVYGNSGGPSGEAAIRVSGATSKVTISSSVIAGNVGPGGGLDIASPFTITNTVIAANGKSLTGTVGGASLRAASGTFMFNTVADNIAAGGANNGIVCGGTTRTISNSIITNNSIDIGTCTNASYLLTDAALPIGTNNTTGNPKFLNTRNPLEPTFYRIGADSAAKDKGDPAAPVDVDIDGQARDDGLKDIGADEYKEP